MRTMRASPELRDFIRRTLGCGCPDAVFEAVAVRRGALARAAREEAWWIEVGGRLLIAVADAEAAPGLAGRLAEVVDVGCASRDKDGFNRFRLVVPSVPGLDADALGAAFAPLASGDDRLHLHVVAPGALPSLTATEHVA